MRVRIRAIWVLTACSTLATVAVAPAEAREPFDVLIDHVESPFFENDDTYVRTRPGGAIRIAQVFVHNFNRQRAPATKVGFRWTKDGPIVETVSVRAME